VERRRRAAKIMSERRRDMVGTCTAHWTLLTRGMAFMAGFLLLLWGGMGHTAEAPKDILNWRHAAAEWALYAHGRDF